MPPTYHVVQFERLADGAAFVAALSRFLASPAWAATRPTEASAELWAGPVDIEKVEFFLSEAAFEATRAAFSPVPTVRMGPLPPGAERLIQGPMIAAWGMAEVERRLRRS